METEKKAEAHENFDQLRVITTNLSELRRRLLRQGKLAENHELEQAWGYLAAARSLIMKDLL